MPAYLFLKWEQKSLKLINSLKVPQPVVRFTSGTAVQLYIFHIYASTVQSISPNAKQSIRALDRIYQRIAHEHSTRAKSQSHDTQK
jgi:hypothetical protein